MKNMPIGSVIVYIDRDKEGYVSLSTDGHLESGDLDRIISALQALQDDDDREYESILNASAGSVGRRR